MPFEFGDIVLVAFPFTSQDASKKRPAVIVSSRAYNSSKPDVVVMAVTSQLRPTSTLGDVRIGDWQAAGLIKPSAIKSVFARLSSRSLSADLAHWAPPTRLRSENRSAKRPDDFDGRNRRSGGI
jgi:mRNA interferase MazF